MAILRSACFLLIFGTTLYSISDACETCNTPWKKVYEHDINGSAVMGKKQDLLDSFQRGGQVKVMIPSLGEAGQVFDVEAPFTWYPDLCGRIVPHVIKDGWDHFLYEGDWLFGILCNDGYYKLLSYTLGSTNMVNTKEGSVGMVWFIKDSTCPTPVYSHTSDGSVISGSKDELKNALLDGYDMRYKFGRYLLFSNNLNISENGEDVVAQSVWNVWFGSILVWWFQMVATNGLTHRIVFNIGERDGQLDQSYHYKMEWYVEPCWRHVFTNDQNGVEQDGSLADLIAAAELGFRVKVVMGTYSVELDNVRTGRGHVSGQILSQVSKNDSYTFGTDTFWFWQMVHSTGVVRTRRYSNGSEDTVETKRISWFVDTRPWEKVLSTDSNAIVTSGSKAALKNAVENGASIRIGLQFGPKGKRGLNGEGHTHHGHKESGWFVMNAEQLEFGPDGEVAAELIKCVSTEEVSSNEYNIQDNPYWRFMIVTTRSDVQFFQWRVGAHINDGNFSERANVNWFVNY